MGLEIMTYEERLARLKQKSAMVPTLEQFALLEQRLAQLELYIVTSRGQESIAANLKTAIDVKAEDADYAALGKKIAELIKRERFRNAVR